MDMREVLQKQHPEELDKLYDSLKLGIILLTILIPVILAVANMSINIEATSVLASNNSFGHNPACNSANTISAYYSCELNITQEVYLPQYSVLMSNVALLLFLITTVIFTLMISQHLNIRNRGLALGFSGIIVLLSWSLSLTELVQYVNAIDSSISLIIIPTFFIFLILTGSYILLTTGKAWGIQHTSVIRWVLSVFMKRTKFKKVVGGVLIVFSLILFYCALNSYSYYFHKATSNISNFSILFIGIGVFFAFALIGAILFAIGLRLLNPKIVEAIVRRAKDNI